jgi:molybdopterin converting factor small subunit
MKVLFDFLTLFRERIGANHLELEVQGDAPTVLAALQALQRAQAGREVRLLEGEGTVGGLLVFLKGPGGGLTRVLRPAEERIAQGQTVVLSAAMGGG